MADAHYSIRPHERPPKYEPPKSFGEVEQVLRKLKDQRQPVIDRIWESKRAVRGEWGDVIRQIPSSYKQMLLPPDLPQLRDMVYRVSGIIRRQEPMIEVTPPSAKDADVRAASKEESRLTAVRLQVSDQQERDPWAMGIDAQAQWGESWVTVWPDPKRLQWKGYERRKGEAANDYLKRRREAILQTGVPLCIQDHDPLTVFEYRTDNDRLGLWMAESQHTDLDVEMGMGYKPIRNSKGQVENWLYTGGTLSQPYVAEAQRFGGGSAVDTTHDSGRTSDGFAANEHTVRKVIWLDPWTYQCWLDGVLVEEWEHNWGIVPAFGATGGDSADRDPGWSNHSLIDPALQIGKQIIWYSAVLSSNAAIHGFPTPFLENPQHGMTVRGNEPMVRKVELGKMNMLAAGEKVTFPYLEASMLPDFFKYLDYLTNVLDRSTLADFGKALGGDTSGYLVAQVRAMELSILTPIYTSAARRERKINYFIRWLIQNKHLPPLILPGAVETDDEGRQYRPILDYGPEHCTEYAINVHVEEGIKQDEMAERKSAIEMNQSGLWSRRRAMEHTGVEDSAQESDEIDTDRVLQSPAADEVVLQMAVKIATERLEATRQDMSSPFYQALEEAKGAVMGDGQFQNQGGMPMNADAGGAPLAQQQQVQSQQGGGPTTGPGPREGIDQRSLGVPGMPGGVRGKQQTPAV